VTEIAIPDRHSNGDVVPAAAQASPLVLWAHEARQAEQIAEVLACTSFVPASLRNKPQDVTAAILAGQELGLQPMATLRSIDIIQGVPALRAHAMRGLVQFHGHKLQLVESTPQRCVMRGQRKGEEWQQVEWTIERAAQLGLTGKDQWKKQPQTMLVARATGELCRLIAADALYAMPYAAEELDGDSPGGGNGPARVTVEEIVTARQGTAEQPTPPAATEQRRAADGQLRELNILFTETGIAAHTGKGSTALNDKARFDWLAEHVGVTVVSTKDLTPDQATKAIGLLHAAQVDAATARGQAEKSIAGHFDRLDPNMTGTARLQDLSRLLGRAVMGPQDINHAELVDIAALLADCPDTAVWAKVVDAAEAQHKAATDEPGL
jgi:hypothetical protein